MNVEDVIAERIAAARHKITANRERRQRQQQARTAGLAQRHAAKLRHLAASNATPCASGGPA